MKTFEDLFTDENIISYLCKVRCKLAKQRNKKHLLHLLTDDDKYNYHRESLISQSQRDFQDQLDSFFPPRKKWKKLGERDRFPIDRKSGKVKKLNSIEKNEQSLVKTIHFYRKQSPQPGFIIRLDAFIAEIKSDISDPNYILTPPDIYPKVKEKKALNQLAADEFNVCRPLSLFALKERIILSFTNNYLTKIFDKHFMEASLAFRATPGKIINHHTAIQRLLKYKNDLKEQAFWVAECDMKKFYDTVDHQVVLNAFQQFVTLVKSEYPDIDLTNCNRLFYSYLKCYCFNLDAKKYNSNPKYWEDYKIPKGKFEWIETEISTYSYYKEIEKERIGVPQGGALSGLIANLVLHQADQIMSDDYPDVFYLRFCDDMIILHPDEQVCRNSITAYTDYLRGIRLAPHAFKDKLREKRKTSSKYLPEESLKLFWKEKSKGPYRWGKFDHVSYPWIGFVGYEINFDGSVRIRKSSFEKELDKQVKVIDDIKGAIKKEVKAKNGTITESAIKRLIGMSVGRAELWNYLLTESEMCWANGFKELTPDKYTIKQIKALDKGRSKAYYDLVKLLTPEKKQDVPSNDIDDNLLEVKGRQIIGYNKPFSYYLHTVEKKKSKS